MKKEVSYEKDKACRQALLAIKDTMELLSGKWKNPDYWYFNGKGPNFVLWTY